MVYRSSIKFFAKKINEVILAWEVNLPEGPEVKRIVDQVGNLISGQTLTGLKIISGRYLKGAPDGLEGFAQQLPIEITGVNCKGKFLYFKTNQGWNIWNTLGLTGGWTKNIEHEFIRVGLYFQNLPPIYFHDMRNFGTLKFIKTEAELSKKLGTLGLDFLQEEIPDLVFRTKFKKNSVKTLPEVLMDQKIFAGVGNYIKAEALYLAKLSPHRLAGSLTDEELANLNRAIRSIMVESYKTGGSTFRTYADFNDTPGTFTSRFMVYGKKEDPLGNKVIKEETKDKRTTHWVPKIQY